MAVPGFLKNSKSIYLTYAILVALYLALAFVVPPSEHTKQLFHITTFQYRIMLFFLLLPYTVIWFAAFFAYAKLTEYTLRIRGTRESKAFKDITIGVGVMAFGLAIPAIISMILNGVSARYENFRPTASIINSYVSLLVPVIAFSIIGNGARKLTEIVRTRPSQRGTRTLMVVFIMFGVYYCYLVLRSNFRGDNAYHLPTGVMLLSVIVPYLYAWFSGLLAAYELGLYAQKVKGLFYKRALGWLAVGITIAISSSIFIQYISSIYANKSTLNLGSVLLVLYILLLIEAVGYASIAVSANRLKKIEDI